MRLLDRLRKKSYNVIISVGEGALDFKKVLPNGSTFDALELRIDLLKEAKDFFSGRISVCEYTDLVKREILFLQKSYDKPVILTARDIADQGKFPLDLSLKIDVLKLLIDKVDAVDVELRLPDLVKANMDLIKKSGVDLIISHHDFERSIATDELEWMGRNAKKLWADITKIATVIEAKKNLVDMVNFTYNNREKNFITIGMGDLGRISRLILPLFGSLATFSCDDGLATAPGQIDITQMGDLVEFFNINKFD